MAQDGLTNIDSGEANKKQDRASGSGLRWIYVAGFVLFFALLLVSIFHPYLTERVKFFTENALSLLVLLIILVQSYIYRRQWDAMQGQLEAMKEQGRVMSASLAQNERAVQAAERNVKIAEENAADTRDAMFNQKQAMRYQLSALDDQAAASRASARAAERSVEVAEEAFYIGQRAYVGIKRMEIRNLSIGNFPTLIITWVNGGKTPAWRFRSIPSLILGDKPTQKAGFSWLEDDFSDISASFIPAGDERRVEYEITNFRVTEEVISDIENRLDKRLYALAEGSYLDIKGKQRPFRVWALYDRYSGGFVELEDDQKEYYPT